MSLADGNAIAYGGAVVAFGAQPAFVSSHTEHDFFQLLFSWKPSENAAQAAVFRLAAVFPLSSDPRAPPGIISTA